MERLRPFLRKKIFIYGAVAVVLLIVGILIFKGNEPKEETIMVHKGNFENKISVSGKVIASENVDLGFKSSGMVKQTSTVGQLVKKGQIIASLDSTDVLGSLKVAQANYEKVIKGATSAEIDVVKSQVEVAQVSLDQIKKQQEILVDNAKKNLLNSGFILTTDDNSSNKIPPIISGTYLKEAEGQIIFTEYPSSGGYSFQTTGLVKTNGMVNTEIPQPISDTGLYIKFSTASDNTKWILNIPDKQSAKYLENYNAYQAALATQTQALNNATAVLNEAQSNLSLKQVSARPEDVSSAYGSLLIAKGAYDDRFIYAPFDGVITKTDAKEGEIVSTGTPLISMINADTFQIESYIPEVNIAAIKVGNEANVNLDAYGSQISFSAKVVAIDPAETIKDGVSTYKTTLQFLEKDDRIKSGMTANVSIITFSKPSSIFLPGGVIFEKNNKKFVQVRNEDGSLAEKEIAIGSVSSLGQTEIISGLSEGDVVILNPVIK